MGFFKSSAARVFNGQTMLSSPSRLWIESSQDGPDSVEHGPLILQDVQVDVALSVHLGVAAELEEFTVGSSKESVYLQSSYTVPAAP